MATSFAERLDREREAAFAAASRGDRTRKAALDSLAEIGLPTNRDDNWKYANLRALERVRLVSAGEPAHATLSVLPERIEGFSRQVFVDGLHSAQLSDPSPAKPAFGFESLRSSGEAAAETVPGSRAHAADLRFALLNTAFAVDGARITVRGHGDEPVRIELDFVATVDGAIAASYPRIELLLAAGARLQLIERHVSEGDAASFVNSAAEISVGEGAKLAHFRIQQMGARALWVDTLNAEVARDGRYELHAVGLGASSARSTCFVRLAGEGAHACVYAAAVADRHQTLDGFVRVEHVGPRTTTDEIFRGIASGRSRVAFNGAVIVQSSARGTDSKQSLRGLLAGPGAEIDARPQLEIYTDEVRCSHGATAGTLDENMLFYLLSRGIDRETARSLLEWVFLEDVIAKIGVPELRRQVENAVAGRLRNVNLQELM